MKRLFFLLFVIFVLAGFSFLFWNKTGEKTQAPSLESPRTNAQQTVIHAEESAGIPTRVRIPSIGVNAAIESVGMDEKRAMDVPKDPMNTGWYNLGYRPGNIGSAVIDGHVDTKSGAPAVFANLSTLTTGAEVVVTDEKNSTYSFYVTDIKTYPYDAVPIKQVFDDRSGKKLHLITCSGEWDKQASNYSNRTVVFAQMPE